MINTWQRYLSENREQLKNWEDYVAACAPQDAINATYAADGHTGAEMDTTYHGYAAWYLGRVLGWRDTREGADELIRDQCARDRQRAA